jgi:hypothetical protein
MAHHFSRQGSAARERCLLSGFGVGLSWGVASMMVDGVFAPPIVELA